MVGTAPTNLPLGGWVAVFEFSGDATRSAMAQHFRTEFMQVPVVTRVYCTTCILTTLAVQLQVVTPIQLLYYPDLVLQGEVWRLLTCFLFYGYLGFGFLFNMIFLYRFCRKLEETSFSGRTADFVVLLLFGAILTLVSSPLTSPPTHTH
jgi:Derlin-2/3